PKKAKHPRGRVPQFTATREAATKLSGGAKKAFQLRVITRETPTWHSCNDSTTKPRRRSPLKRSDVAGSRFISRYDSCQVPGSNAPPDESSARIPVATPSRGSSFDHC